MLPDDRTWRDWLLWVMWYLYAPVLAVVILASAGPDLGDAWSAAHGGGLLGTLHVTSKECGKVCSLRGDYTSQSGDTLARDVLLDADPRGAGVGSDVPVRYFGRDAVVYMASGSHEWAVMALLLAAAVVAVVLWFLSVGARGFGLKLPWWHTPPTTEDLLTMAEAELARRRPRRRGLVRRRHHHRT